VISINFDTGQIGGLMLVLTRKVGESISIDDNIKIRVVQLKGKQVRLGIEAPKETKIHREEVYESVKKKNIESFENISKIKKLIS